MSGDVLKRYLKELGAEISDPARLAAVYGAGFADADVRRQAEVVCKMATSMVEVANAAINVVGTQTQESVALVLDGQIINEQGSYPFRESFCKHVIATGRELAVEDALEHPLVCNTNTALDGVAVSYLGVPVANRAGVIVGSLCVWAGERREWTTADVGMLTQLSMVLTRALH